MIRQRDNPPPETDGPVTTYYGPAKNRPALRVYALWCYASIRHRATMSDFWFHLWCRCASAIQLDGGFHSLDELESGKVYAAVMAKHCRRHHPFESPAWTQEHAYDE